MDLDRFAALLKQAMGLDVASVGPTTLQRAIAERQRARQIRDVAAYWTCVQTSRAELQCLVDAVAVPETWFFRDSQAFVALVSEVLGEWRREPRMAPMRVLSMPCSTGEEPYSIAMTLLDAGLSPEQFRVDAMDISDGALAQARCGVFGANAFRTKDLSFRDRFFDAAPGGYRIADRVRAPVRFEQGNLLAPDLLVDRGGYDAVFCRNVLIYFDRETQGRAIDTLSRLLGPRGVLFVGPSESGLFLSGLFTSAKMPMAFAFRKTSIPGQPTATAVTPRPTRLASVTRSTRARAVAGASPSAPSRHTETQAHDAGLDEAKRLADEGRFVEAALSCDAVMERGAPSADAYYLLGLVRDASGNHREAADYYRKALYLDPGHEDALVHLALLLEVDGQAAEARRLRDRIRRLAQGSRA